MFGFEEQWDLAEWGANGIHNEGVAFSADDSNFSTWANTSGLPGFVTGSRSYKAYYSYYLETGGHYDTALWTEDNSGTGACVSGRVGVTVMVDNIGGTGHAHAEHVVGVRPKGVSIGTANPIYPNYYIASIRCTASGPTWTATLWVGSASKAVLPITMGREVPMRFGIEWFWEDNRYVARALFNGVAVSDWYARTDAIISPPSQSIGLRFDGLNSTNSTGGLTGATYATCFDDIVHISDTISAIDTTTQVVTRDEAEPPNVCENIYVRALDVASISANTGAWGNSSATDINIANSQDTATKVETTDAVTAKPLRMDVAFDALSGTAPDAILGMTVRCNASKDTFVTDLQMSEDNFVSTITDATTVLGEGATPTEISTTVKAAGGALDVTAVDAMELGFRVTA